MPVRYGKSLAWHSLWIILPSSAEFLLPVHPCLGLGVHIVLVDGVLVGESALHFTTVVIYLLTAILVHRAAHRPNHAELEPELHHTREVLTVCGIHLHTTHCINH